MDYVYKIAGYTEVEEDLRGIFGVTDVELSNTLIHRLTNLPAAELLVQQQVLTPLEDYLDQELTYAKLAVLYTAAANCLQAVRMNILLKESDTKTTAVRFKDTLLLSEASLLDKAGAYLDKLTRSMDSPDLLSFISPANDEVTGLANA